MGKKGKRRKAAARRAIGFTPGTKAKRRRWWQEEEDVPLTTGTAWDDGDSLERGRRSAMSAQQGKMKPHEVDPAIARALTDYRIYEGPDSLRSLTKPRTWFMAGNGLVLVLKTPIGAFTGGKGLGEGVPGLPVLGPGISLNCPKLPWSSLAQTVAFFRTYKTEVMIQFFWDPVRQAWQEHIPLQVVSGGGIHHLGEFDAEGKLWHVFDIHSHNTMGAFWSATDDGDESRFEGRLYGVIGDIDRAIPSMKWRTHVGGAFVDLEMADVIDLSGVGEVEVKRAFSPAHLIKVAGNAKDNTHFTFQYDPFEGATFPPSWKAPVLDAEEVARFRGHQTVVFEPDHTVSPAERARLESEGFWEVRASPSAIWTKAPRPVGQGANHSRIIGLEGARELPPPGAPGRDTQPPSGAQGQGAQGHQSGTGRVGSSPGGLSSTGHPQGSGTTGSNGSNYNLKSTYVWAKGEGKLYLKVGNGEYVLSTLTREGVVGRADVTLLEVDRILPELIRPSRHLEDTSGRSGSFGGWDKPKYVYSRLSSKLYLRDRAIPSRLYPSALTAADAAKQGYSIDFVESVDQRDVVSDAYGLGGRRGYGGHQGD